MTIFLAEISSGIGICDIYIYFISLLMDSNCYSLGIFVSDIAVCILTGVMWGLINANDH